MFLTKERNLSINQVVTKQNFLNLQAVNKLGNRLLK